MTAALVGLCCALALVVPPDAAAAARGAREVTPLWTASGTGFVSTMAIGDLDADGEGDLVVGGRGVLALGPTSPQDGRPRWVNKWPDGVALGAGDNSFAKSLLMEDVTGDGIPEAVVGGDEGLYALDGRTGEPVWRNTTETPNGGHSVAEAAGGDFTGDGIADVVLGHFLHDRILAVDGRTGADLWTYPRPGTTAALEVADVDGDGTLDVVHAGANFLAGPDVHVISGRGAATTGVAAPLWAQEFPGGDPVAIAIGQVVAGGAAEIVVGGFAGHVVVYDAVTGASLASWVQPGRGRVADLLVTDLGGDAAAEIVVANGFEDDGGHAASVDVYDGEGTLRWSHNTPSPPAALATADADGDGFDEVVVAGGWRTFGGRTATDGFLTVLEPDVDAPVVAWQHMLATRVAVLAVGEVFGEDVIVAGHDPHGGVQAFGLDGTPRWSYRTGGQGIALAPLDVDGDGGVEVLAGATDSIVALYGHDGQVLWQERLPGVGGADPVTIASGDLVGTSTAEVLVGTSEYGGGPGGRVHALSLDDGLQWSYDTPGPFGEVRVEDLDGDGHDDVVAGAGGAGLSGEGARVARLDRHGGVVWEQDVPPSIGLAVELAHVNPDDVVDVIVGTSPLGRSTVLALDGASGAELWRMSPPGILNWMELSPSGGAVAVGDSQGIVQRLDPRTGQVVWEAPLDRRSADGSWLPDVTGDGHAELVSGSAQGRVSALDGASGAVLWTAQLNPGDEVSTIAPLHGPGRPRVAVGSTSNTNGRRGGTYLLDAATGGRLAKEPTEHHVEALLAVDLDGHAGDELVSAAGWQLHALAPSYAGSSGRAPERAELQGSIVGSNPAAPFTTGVTEAEFAETCAIPASQGVDGLVLRVPAPIAGTRGTASISAAAANGFPSFAVSAYSAACAPLGRATSLTVFAVSPQTRYLVLTAVSGAATDVTVTLVGDE